MLRVCLLFYHLRSNYIGCAYICQDTVSPNFLFVCFCFLLLDLDQLEYFQGNSFSL